MEIGIGGSKSVRDREHRKASCNTCNSHHLFQIFTHFHRKFLNPFVHLLENYPQKDKKAPKKNPYIMDVLSMDSRMGH